MNILLIGNGFDLDNDLPTKYDDFLNFVKALSKVIKDDNTFALENYNNKKIPESDVVNAKVIKKLIMDFNLPSSSNAFAFWKTTPFWKSIIVNNLWIEYFNENRKYIDNNWIDFEKEIFYVVSNMDEIINKFGFIDETNFFQPNYHIGTNNRNFKILLETYFKKNNKTIIEEPLNSENFITELEKDLEKLIHALDIYINHYVNTIDVDSLSIDILTLKIDKVISFNYSNTFNRLYADRHSNKIEFDYIHGKASINESLFIESNLVLGINEYLPDDSKDKNIKFIRFKKFFQRIYKNTGIKYIDWINEIKGKAKYLVHHLYIFGHSLNETDGDILKSLILNDNVITTIFYHNSKAYDQQIINLVKVIGQEELLRRTGGSERTILFVKQSDFRKII